MSVLENLRKGTDSTSTRLMIGVIVAVFIFWGVGSGSGDKTSIYASVNGTTITDSDFRRAYVPAARQAGRNLSEDEEKELGAKILTNLIQQEALLQEADRLGVTVSDEEVVREYVKIPSFQVDGKFDEKTYERLLKQNNLSRAQFEDDLRRDLVVRKLYDMAGFAVAVTEAELRQAYTLDGTTLDLSFVRLPATAFLDEIPVTEAERTTFVNQNGDRIKARYDEGFDRFYNLKKRYQLRTILLRTDLPGTEEAAVEARAKAIQAEAAAGADFETLAKRWSEDLTASNGGQLGVQAVDQLEGAIVTAADAAGVGKVSDVVKTSRGFQILLVEKIEDAKVISLDEAKNDIAVAMIKEEKAPEVVKAYAAKVIEAWKAQGAPPVELLAEKKLSPDTTGEFSLGDPEVPRLGDSAELRQQIEKAPQGYVVPTPLELKGNVFVVGVAARTEADPAKFEESRSQIEGRLKAQRKAALIEQWTSDVLARATVERNQF